MKLCPYCIKPLVNSSRDHIFNDFLGGKRTIESCRECNNKFGETFEAQAAKTLHKLHISITSWGLPLVNNVPRWKNAITHKGVEFDLISENGEVTPQLSKPIVEKNKSGEMVSLSYRSEQEAIQAIKSTQKRGKSINEKIKKIQFEISPYQIPIDYLVDNNLMCLAVKMCVACATQLPNFELLDTLLGRLVLNKQSIPHTFVTVAFNDYLSLDRLREPLSHLVYVERNQSKVIGVVQFFGVVQLHCFIGRSDKGVQDGAILGKLDPIMNVESFEILKHPLIIKDPDNPFLNQSLIKSRMASWSRKFEEAAKARGASKPVKLVGSVTTGITPPKA